MTITKEQLRTQVETEVEAQFDTYITDRIDRLKNFGIEADYNDVFDRIVEKMMSGYDSDNFKVLDGNDEYEFEVLDFWSYIADFPCELDIDQLISYLDDDYTPQIDSYNNTEWIIKDIAEMYDEDSKDLYKSGHFNYCDNYMGALYLEIHGDDFINFDAENLDDYPDNMEQSIDDISAEVGEFDIDDLFNSVMIDMGWAKTYSVDYDEVKAVEKRAKESIRNELKNIGLNLAKEINLIDEEINYLGDSPLARKCLEGKNTDMNEDLKKIAKAI